MLLLSSLLRRQWMNQGRTVFSQLVEFLPTYQFQICVDRYQGNRYVKDFSCWDQFLCLALLSSPTAKVSAISKLAFVPSNQALSYGLPGASFSQHVGTRQRASRLADLRRFCPGPDCPRSRPLPRRTFRRGVVRDRVCPMESHRASPLL